MTYKEPSADLKQMMTEVLHSFKAQIGEQTWPSVIKDFPEDLKHGLMSKFGV